MKKRVIILVSAIALIVIGIVLFRNVKIPLSPLETLDNEDIEMTIKEDSLTSTGATIIITNKSDIKYITGRSYKIDKSVVDKWYGMKMKEKMVVTADALEIVKDNPLEDSINWERYYGNLEKGKYRIVKQVSKADKYNKNYDIYVEFEIK